MKVQLVTHSTIPNLNSGLVPIDPVVLVFFHTKMQCAESPVVEFTNKVTRTNILCEVELTFSIQSQNILKYFRRAIKIKFTCFEIITVA